MVYLTQRWTLSGSFSKNQDTFFDFQKVKGGFPLPFPSCTLVAAYCDIDVQSSYLKAKSLEQRGFGWKHELELKLFFSIFWKFNQIKINKTGVKLQAYANTL